MKCIIFFRDAHKELEKVNDLATEAFNLALDNEARVEATKLKLVAVLMTKVSFHLKYDESDMNFEAFRPFLQSYGETHRAFIPFSILAPSRRREIASLLKATVDRLLAKYKVCA